MLEGKFSKNMDMVFPVSGELITSCSEWMKEAPLKEIHGLCSELVLSMTTDNGCLDRTDKLPMEMELLI